MARKSINGRAAKVYGTYVFREKDPIIGLTLDVMKHSGLARKVISHESGVSMGAISRWEKKGPKGTRRPQFCTINAVGRACGYTLAWTEK